MENNIFYTSHANYMPLSGIQGLMEHLSCINAEYDKGAFCNRAAMKSFGPCSISLKDESYPILIVKEINTFPLFNEKQEAIMDKICGEYIDYNEDTDEEELNYYVGDSEVKKQLENVFINYEEPFCKILLIEVIRFSRDENNNIIRKYESGQITIFKDYSGILHHSTNLDLESLLLKNQEATSLTA